MITFKQFLSEEEKMDFTEWVHTHCQPFLTECSISKDANYDEIWGKATLYRGIKTAGGAKELKLQTPSGQVRALVKSVREDRRPRDTHQQLSAVYDKVLEKKFGWKVRSASLFCFGEEGIDDAKDYGALARIFPIGEFKFVWNPNVFDLTLKMKSILRDTGFNYLKLNSEGYSQEDLEDVKSVFEESWLLDAYKDTDLKQAVRAECEIMFSCKSYLAVQA